MTSRQILELSAVFNKLEKSAQDRNTPAFMEQGGDNADFIQGSARLFSSGLNRLGEGLGEVIGNLLYPETRPVVTPPVTPPVAATSVAPKKLPPSKLLAGIKQ